MLIISRVILAYRPNSLVGHPSESSVALIRIRILLGADATGHTRLFESGMHIIIMEYYELGGHIRPGNNGIRLDWVDQQRQKAA